MPGHSYWRRPSRLVNPSGLASDTSAETGRYGRVLDAGIARRASSQAVEAQPELDRPVSEPVGADNQPRHHLLQLYARPYATAS